LVTASKKAPASADIWSSIPGAGDRAIPRILAVEDAQRILVETGQAVLGKLTPMRLEMADERRTPRITRCRIA
jgi:hypothetical protein